MRITKKTALAATVLGVTGSIALAAHAAVAVIGGGIAHSCYLTAEYGGEPVSGIQTCTRAIEGELLTAHDRASTLVNRGILRMRMNETTYALADYNAALEIDSNLAEAYMNRGSALIAMHRFDESLESTNKAIALGPHEAQLAYYNRAVAEEALGNINSAYDDLKHAVTIAPGFTQAADDLKRYRVVDRRTDGA